MKYRKLTVLMLGGHSVPFIIPAEQEEATKKILSDDIELNGHGLIALGYQDHRYLRGEAIVGFYFSDDIDKPSLAELQERMVKAIEKETGAGEEWKE